MTKSDIIQDLRNIIGPGNPVSDAGLGTWINEAYLEIVAQIQAAIPDYFVKASTTDLVANLGEYELPSDWNRIIMVNIAYDGSTWTRALPMSNIGDVPVHASGSSLGFSEGLPQYYLLGDEIGFRPIPTGSVSDGLKIWYSYDPIALSEDGSIPEIPAKYHHLIKMGAYANFLDRDEEHVAAERMRQRMDLRVFRLIEDLAERQVDQPKSVSIVTNQDMYIDDGFSV